MIADLSPLRGWMIKVVRESAGLRPQLYAVADFAAGEPSLRDGCIESRSDRSLSPWALTHAMAEIDYDNEHRCAEHEHEN